MLKIIEDELIIKRCQKQFTRSFKGLVDEKIPVTIGHPGASFKAKVSWLRRFGMWLFSKKMESRYGNMFGIGMPDKESSISMTCEINFPVRGIDRRVGGALAKDNKGRIFVVHRGKIGGGKKGIGKSLFEGSFRGVWDVMEDGDTKSDVALIGALYSPRFVRQVVQFIRQVNIIKGAAAHQSLQTEIAFNDARFREELVGFPYGHYNRGKEDICNRGLVIVDLADSLSDCGFKPVNDSVHDLFAMDKEGHVTVLFQVITDTSIAVLHEGIASLMLGGFDFSGSPRLVLVLPQPVEGSLKRKLRDMKIEILVYNWQNDRALFPGFQDVITM